MSYKLESSNSTDIFTASLLAYFNGTDNHTTFQIFTQTKALFPDKQHVFVEDPVFSLGRFLATKGHPESVCEGQPGGYTKLVHQDEQEGVPSTVKSVLMDGVFAFEHNKTHFQVYRTSWLYFNGSLGTTHQFVFDGEDDSPGKALVKEVYDWQKALKDEIWVFSNGRWSKDAALYSAIQKAKWDDVVLDETLIRQLKTNTETFFASQDVYKSLEITWKRGILLLGPPGNGKTQTIQVLLKDAISSNIACLYVKSFRSQHGAEYGIRMIFELARKKSPCVLVLEDLDSMVQDEIRSFFLNELDGLERNEGILTIATTNHPEKIDDAILRRPSRFDQKYTFDLPTTNLREQYALKWLAKIKAPGSLHFGDGDADAQLAKEIAEKTENWSFAFLKELFVSFLLRSASDRSLARGKEEVGAEKEKEKGSADVMLEQVGILAEQVSRGGRAIGEEEPSGPSQGRMPFGRVSQVRTAMPIMVGQHPM